MSTPSFFRGQELARGEGDGETEQKGDGRSEKVRLLISPSPLHLVSPSLLFPMDYSIGAPESFHAFQPPAIENTFV